MKTQAWGVFYTQEDVALWGRREEALKTEDTETLQGTLGRARGKEKRHLGERSQHEAEYTGCRQNQMCLSNG